MSRSVALATGLEYGDRSLRLAYRWCKAYTKRRAKNFYYAFAPLPELKRKAIYAVYAFSGYVDDIADEIEDSGEQRAQLDQARARLRACYAGHRSGLLFTALGDAVDRFSVPQRLFEQLIDGVEMDITIKRYAKWEALRQYCYRVASTVGLICITIFGAVPTQDTERYAVDLGVALQLVNIMRDVREDAERGRVYFPADELAAEGLTAEDILGCCYDERFIELMRKQAQRARTYLESGRQLLPVLDLRSRMCVNVLQGMYVRILERIETREYDVLSQPVRLSGREKLVAVAGLWAEATRRRCA
jgi:phytoene synthase